MFKNVSGQKISVTAWDVAAGTYKTGDAANITLYVNKDWAGVTALTDTSATELSSTNAPGRYIFDLTQAETNANALDFTGKSSTSGVIIIPQTVYTLPANFAVLNIDSSGVADANLVNVRGDVSAGQAGYVGVDWNALTNPTASQPSVHVFDIGSSAITNSSFQDNAISASKITDGSLTAAKFGADAITSTVLATSAANKINDALLLRNVGGGSNTGQLVCEALFFMHGNWSISNNVLTVTNPNTSAVSWQAALGTNPAAKPIVSSSPS